MYDDHEFDPITPDEEAQRQQDEEFARRVRREIRRVERGEADAKSARMKPAKPKRKLNANKPFAKNAAAMRALSGNSFQARFSSARGCRTPIPTCSPSPACFS